MLFSFSDTTFLTPPHNSDVFSLTPFHISLPIDLIPSQIDFINCKPKSNQLTDLNPFTIAPVIRGKAAINCGIARTSPTAKFTTNCIPFCIIWGIIEYDALTIPVIRFTPASIILGKFAIKPLANDATS